MKNVAICVIACAATVPAHAIEAPRDLAPSTSAFYTEACRAFVTGDYERREIAGACLGFVMGAAQAHGRHKGRDFCPERSSIGDQAEAWLKYLEVYPHLSSAPAYTTFALAMGLKYPCK